MTWEVTKVKNRIVYLIDNGIGKSITNDAERVLDWVAHFYPGHQVVYQDTDGLWWTIRLVYQIQHADDRWHEVEFKPWHGEMWHVLNN